MDLLYASCMGKVKEIYRGLKKFNTISIFFGLIVYYCSEEFEACYLLKANSGGNQLLGYA